MFSLDFCLYVVNLDVTKKKKRKEKKRNKKKYSKSECMCLDLFYFLHMFVMIKLQRLKKNLIFWLDHGQELLTYT